MITALANLQSGRSQLGLAQTNEKRAHELYLAKGGALKDWQQAQTNLITAENTVRADEIALAAVRHRLRILGKSDQEIASLEAQPMQKLNAATIVTAPIAGTITQRQVGIGQYVNSLANGATTPVYTIGDLSTVWLIANVREVDTPWMDVGHPVEVRVLALPGRIFKAEISWVAPSIDPNTHRLPIRADVENHDGALKPGMFADFSIITGEPSTAPAVPQVAVVYEGDHVRVWVAGAGDTLALREIRTGRSSAVGSSRSSTFGRTISARISASRSRSPVDRRVIGQAFASSGNPRSLTKASAAVHSLKCSPTASAHQPGSAGT